MKYFDSKGGVKVTRIAAAPLFFNVKVQVGKKLLALHEFGWRGKTKRPPKLHYRFCTKQLNVDMWQPRKHKPDLPKLAKLMHQGHQDS